MAQKADQLQERLAQFSVRCIRMLDALPSESAGTANIRNQLSRSASAVGANYAEACLPESRKDFISKMSKAMKEAKESVCWIRIVCGMGHFPAERTAPLLQEAHAIVRILGKSISTAHRNAARPGRKEE